jgi:lipid-A-disaccharide synthase
MRYYIIAGEASGDLHGGNLIKALHMQDKEATVRCWGGDNMEAAGATLVKHYRDLAFMGFVEVIRHLREIFRNIEFCKKDILAFKPHVLVLIDYPGFNMRIAAWARQQGIRIVYYISPQVWAWKEKRVEKIKRDVDKMLVILPFETDFYKKWDYGVSYVGHPLIEVVGHEKNKPAAPPISDKPIIALLPGSRAQEIKIKLPVMLCMAKYFPDHCFVIAQAPSQPDSLYLDLIGGTQAILVKGQTAEAGQGRPGDQRHRHAGDGAFWRAAGGVLQGQCHLVLAGHQAGERKVYIPRKPHHGQAGSNRADTKRPHRSKP